MSPTPLPGLDLDLDYPAADPALRLAERSVLAGRRLRLRRRAGAVAAALLLGAAAGSWWAGGASGSPDGSVRVASSPAGLPVAVGRGPARAAFVDPTFRGAPGSAAGLVPYPDRFVDLGNPDGLTPQRAYLTRDGSFCTSTDRRGADPAAGSCRGLDHLPAEGIWAVTSTAETRWEPGPTVTVDGTPVTSTELSVKRSSSVAVVGVVRGPVSRVEVSEPGGRVYDARLEAAPNPLLGTVFTVTFPWRQPADPLRAFTPSAPSTASMFGTPSMPSAGSSLDVAPQPAHGVTLGPGTAIGAIEVGIPLQVTVYRGDGAVFRCDAQTCLAS